MTGVQTCALPIYGVIAPDYTDEALEILKSKRKGGYNVVKIDPGYTPAPIERRSIYGIVFEQGYNDLAIDEKMLENLVTANKELPQQAKHDMLLSLITLKYTQSNSVCYVKDGMTIGVGAGQQSRIHCTRLAGNKADTMTVPGLAERSFFMMIDSLCNLKLISIFITNATSSRLGLEPPLQLMANRCIRRSSA